MSIEYSLSNKYKIFLFSVLMLFVLTAKADVETACPAISDIRAEQGDYTAPTSFGLWRAVNKGGGMLVGFSQGLFWAENGTANGYLVNCTYVLEGGDTIDMRMYKEPGQTSEENFDVSIEGKPHWKKASPSAGDKFYECENVAPQSCQFRAIGV